MAAGWIGQARHINDAKVQLRPSHPVSLLKRWSGKKNCGEFGKDVVEQSLVCIRLAAFQPCSLTTATMKRLGRCGLTSYGFSGEAVWPELGYSSTSMDIMVRLTTMSKVWPEISTPATPQERRRQLERGKLVSHKNRTNRHWRCSNHP